MEDEELPSLFLYCVIYSPCILKFKIAPPQQGKQHMISLLLNMRGQPVREKEIDNKKYQIRKFASSNWLKQNSARKHTF